MVLDLGFFHSDVILPLAIEHMQASSFKAFSEKMGFESCYGVDFNRLQNVVSLLFP